MKNLYFAILSLIVLVLTQTNSLANAPESDPIMIIEVHGKQYYIKDPKILQALIDSDACINDMANGRISNVYYYLYDACYIATLNTIGKIRNQISSTPLTNRIDLENKLDRTELYTKQDEVLVYAQHITHLDRTNLNNVSQKLETCLIRKENLQRLLNEIPNKKKQTIKINYDIDKCISNVKIDSNANQDYCPMSPVITDKRQIDNILHLNDIYRFNSFNFEIDQAQPIKTHNKIIIFNGNVLIACENDIPKYIVKPTYSGREECQNGIYQNIPNAGGTPNGVYLIREQNIQNMPSKKQDAYGAYRIALIPANETETYGRTNMYLHGTTNPGKHRTIGCISLGISIGDFIETHFIEDDIPIIVNVDTVYQDWK